MKQFGKKLDVLLGIGLAVVVIVLTILGSFCDFMLAIANIKGFVWIKIDCVVQQLKKNAIEFRGLGSLEDPSLERYWDIVHIPRVKQIKGQNEINLSSLFNGSSFDETDLVGGMLSITQSALGPYLSTAFGWV